MGSEEEKEKKKKMARFRQRMLNRNYYTIFGYGRGMNVLMSAVEGDRTFLLVIRKGKAGVLPNPGSIEPEDVWNGTACETNEGKKRTGPLVVQSVVHLDGEQHTACTPHGPQKGLGRKGGRRLVLVGVHCNAILSQPLHSLKFKDGR
jgi:hypothetical protein